MSMFRQRGRTTVREGTTPRVEGDFPAHGMATLPVSRREQIVLGSKYHVGKSRTPKQRPRLRGRR